MKYKAIIFDLDGTAIPNKPNGKPSQKLIEVIKRADKEMLLSAATGRPISNAAYILEALGLTNPCVISAGTQIVDPVSKKIFWEISINKDDVSKIVQICEPYHYEILVRDELMGSGDKAINRSFNEHVNVMYIMQVAKNDADAILTELQAIEGITASPVLSWTNEGVDIHITNRDATKEHAVEELLKLSEVTKDETIGVGDADNDVHLFRSVGHKVAMGNATEKLKGLADEVTQTVDEDGLANIIAKYSSISSDE